MYVGGSIIQRVFVFVSLLNHIAFVINLEVENWTVGQMKIKNGEKWNNKVIAKLIFSVGSKTFNDTNALSEHKTIEYHWRWLESLESRNQLSRGKMLNLEQVN